MVTLKIVFIVFGISSAYVKQAEADLEFSSMPACEIYKENLAIGNVYRTVGIGANHHILEIGTCEEKSK